MWRALFEDRPPVDRAGKADTRHAATSLALYALGARGNGVERDRVFEERDRLLEGPIVAMGLRRQDSEFAQFEGQRVEPAARELSCPAARGRVPKSHDGNFGMVGIVAQQAQRSRPDRKMPAFKHFETDPPRAEDRAELAVRK